MFSIRDLQAKVTEIATGSGLVSTASTAFYDSPVAILLRIDTRVVAFFVDPKDATRVAGADYTKSDGKNTIRQQANDYVNEVFQGDFSVIGKFLVTEAKKYIIANYPRYAEVLLQFKDTFVKNGTLAVGVRPNDATYYLMYNAQFLASQVVISAVYNTLLNPSYVVTMDSIIGPTVFWLLHETYHVSKAHMSAMNGTLNVEDPSDDLETYNYVYDSQINSAIAAFMPHQHGSIKFDFVDRGNIFWLTIEDESKPWDYVHSNISGVHPFYDDFMPFLDRLLNAKNYNARSAQIIGMWVNFKFFFEKLSPKQCAGGISKLKRDTGTKMVRDMVDISDYINDAVKKIKDQQEAIPEIEQAQAWAANLPAFTHSKTQSSHPHDAVWTFISGSVIHRPNAFHLVKLIDAFRDLTIIPVMKDISADSVYELTDGSAVVALQDFKFDENDAEMLYIGPIKNTIKVYSYKSRAEESIALARFAKLLFPVAAFAPGIQVTSKLFNGKGTVTGVNTGIYAAKVDINGVERVIALPSLRIVRGGGSNLAKDPFKVGQMVIYQRGKSKSAYIVVGKDIAGKIITKKATPEQLEKYLQDLKDKANSGGLSQDEVKDIVGTGDSN